MKKKIMAFSTALVLSTVFGVQASFGAVNIKVDKLLQPEMSEVINKDGYNLVEMRALFNMLGVDVKWNAYKRTATAKKGESEIIIYVDESKAVIDGKEEKITPGVVISDGKTMLPIRYVSEILGAKIDWDIDTQTISVTTNNGINENEENAVTVLTFEEALEKAKNNDSSLKNLDDSINYLDDLRDDLSVNYQALDNYGTYLNATSSVAPTISESDKISMGLQENALSIIQICRSIKNVDMQKSEMPINEEMINDSIELKLLSYLVAIENYEMNINLLQESINLAEENVENMKLKYELGMESEYNLITAQNELKTNKSDLETLKLTLDSQRKTLNHLLGVEEAEKIEVDMDTNFDELSDIKLESYITVKKQSDPSIILLKNDLELASYTNKTTGLYTGESKIEAANNAKAAERALADAQDSMEKNIKTTYNTINQLIEKDKALKVKVEQAVTDYNAVVASYQAGSATMYQVRQAKVGILKAENDVEANKLTYKTTVFTFERPYMLG